MLSQKAPNHRYHLLQTPKKQSGWWSNHRLWLLNAFNVFISDTVWWSILNDYNFFQGVETCWNPQPVKVIYFVLIWYNLIQISHWIYLYSRLVMPRFLNVVPWKLTWDVETCWNHQPAMAPGALHGCSGSGGGCALGNPIWWDHKPTKIGANNCSQQSTGIYYECRWVWRTDFTMLSHRVSPRIGWSMCQCVNDESLVALECRQGPTDGNSSGSGSWISKTYPN